MVGAAVAWDDPNTRRSHAAYRLGALRWLGGGLAGIAVAIALSTYAVVVLARRGLGVFIVAAFLLGLIGIGTGIGGLIRAHRYRAALQHSPWQAVTLRAAGAHLRLVVGNEDDADHVQGHSVDVRLIVTSRWRVREVVGLRDAQVLVCPLPRGALVLSAEGLDNLYGLHSLAPKRAKGRP